MTFCARNLLSSLLLAGGLCSSSSIGYAQTRECSVSDFQSCKSCAALAAAVDYKKPNSGDFYRGAEWNGLFASYVLNCPIVGAKLIRAGANPSLGGQSGSMILSVSSAWPHKDKKANEAWAALIFAAGANLKQPLKYEGRKTSAEIAREQSFKPTYPELFMLFEK